MLSSIGHARVTEVARATRRTRRNRRNGIALRTGSTALVTLVFAFAAAATASPASAATVSPAIARDFADPAVLPVATGFYAYSTNSGYGGATHNVPVAYALLADGGWADRGDAMPKLPWWVGYTPGTRRHDVWAPDVSQLSLGKYVMYFTANYESTARQCIGVATASSPTGPFGAAGAPLVCDHGASESIDPSTFVDGNGTRYLVYKDSPGYAGSGSTIWLRKLASDGVHLVGNATPILRADRPAEHGIVEAPRLVRHGSHYVLFFSYDGWNSGGYEENYASSTSIGSGYAKGPGNLLASLGLRDPGGGYVFNTLLGSRIAFHAGGSGARELYVRPLNWHGDTPSLS